MVEFPSWDIGGEPRSYYGYSLVHRTAAEALGEIGDKRAVEPLKAALRDEDRGVREKAAMALKLLGYQP